MSGRTPAPVTIGGFMRSLAWLGIRRRHVAALLALSLCSALSEGLGIGMMLPVLEFIGATSGPGEASGRLQGLGSFYAAWHIPVNLLTLLIPVFCLVVIRQLFSYGRLVYTTRIRERVAAEIPRLGFDTFARADMSFMLATGVGRLMNVLTVDGKRAGAAIQVFFEFLSTSTLIGIYVLLLAMASGWAVLPAMAVMAAIYLCVHQLIVWSRRFGERISELNAMLSRALIELLGGLRIVKLAHREQDAAARVGEIVEGLRLKSIAAANMGNRIFLLVEPAAMLFLLAILFVAVELWKISLARIGLFAVIMVRLVPLIRSVLDSRQSLANYGASFQHVEEMIEQARRARTITGGREAFTGLSEGLRAEGVWVQYPDTLEPALRGVDLTIPAGQMTALVGRSGAGKSTLADLIPRLIDPTGGRLAADGRSLQDFSLESLRRQVAFVSQEGFLFDDTVANNIRYERPDATDEQVREAARAARAEEFILALPNGYDTLIGERGVRLSIGQRQRLTLARALLKQAAILILDEPTSALDSETELGIQEALERLRQDRRTTIVVIAHRLSTIARADQIVVLDAGRVVESGTHAKLLHNDEWYARMMGLQSHPESVPTHG